MIKFKTVSFRAGAYVYIEEQQDSSEFYIVRQGALIEENPLNILTGEEDQILKAGDFFGVLDCMSQRARVSSVKVLEDSVLIVVQYNQFEALITQMAPVAMKIIRYFSHRLRRYNSTLSRLTIENLKNGEHNNTNMLYALGAYYQRNGLNLLAGYAFTRFIQSFPHDLFGASGKRKSRDIKLQSCICRAVPARYPAYLRGGHAFISRV